MAKDREINNRIERVETIIQQLESGDIDTDEADRLFEEGQQQLDEVREILNRGEGEIIELPD